VARTLSPDVQEARRAAVEVLLHNEHGPYQSLPRTAGWGYPEPYTRDLMISALGMLVSGKEELVGSLERVLRTLAENQSEHGHIPSLVHDRQDRGASDTTPLFLIGVALYRMATGNKHFLRHAVRKALTWMEYQSPSDRVVVAQQPTSDWRDEQWVPGHALFVNTLVYIFLRLYGQHDRADVLRAQMNRFNVPRRSKPKKEEGLTVPRKPYYALWTYKLYGSERFDLLGNSLAVLAGIPTPSRAVTLVAWVESQCREMREAGELAVDLPPCLFPYIQPSDPDWLPRYEQYEQPGTYHNGGVWPFICGFYVAAIAAVGRRRLAEKKLEALTELVRPARQQGRAFGFNEWLRAQDGTPCGEDWQTWSAAMYLYAVRCVEAESTPFFDEIRMWGRGKDAAAAL